MELLQPSDASSGRLTTMESNATMLQGNKHLLTLPSPPFVKKKVPQDVPMLEAPMGCSFLVKSEV